MPTFNPSGGAGEGTDPDLAGTEPVEPAAAISRVAKPARSRRASTSEGASEAMPGAPAAAVGEPIAAEPTFHAGAIPEIDEPVVDVSRAVVGMVRAREVTARQSGVGAVVAGSASVRMGGVSGILARDATVQMGAASAVIAAQATVQQSLVRTMVANTVQAGPMTGVLFLVARRVDGQPKVLLDWRGGLALGGAILVLGLLGRRRKA